MACCHARRRSHSASCCFLLALAAMDSVLAAQQDARRYPPTMQLGGVPPCIVFDSSGGRFGKGHRIPGAPCLPMVFAPDDHPEAVAIMKEVAARQSQLTYADDVRGFPSEAALKDFVANTTVGFGVVFHTTDYVGLGCPETPCPVEGSQTDTEELPPALHYEIWYNRTTVGAWSARYGLDPVYTRSETS